MSRYINASDVSKLLGRDYSFFWSTVDDIHRIIHSEKNDKDPIKENLISLSKADLESTAKLLGCIPNVDKILKVLETKKRKITESDDYNDLTANFIETLPASLGKVVVDDFCMEYGNVQEKKILENRGIKKDNKLRYLNFKVESQWYKIGCRFDGPQVEIKTRKSKLLGVPDYEKVQIHIYMAVAKCNTWTLIEKYQNTEVEHHIEFDASFFEKVKKDLHKSWEINLRN